MSRLHPKQCFFDRRAQCNHRCVACMIEGNEQKCAVVEAAKALFRVCENVAQKTTSGGFTDFVRQEHER